MFFLLEMKGHHNEENGADSSDRPQKKRFVSLSSIKLVKVPQNFARPPPPQPAASAPPPFAGRPSSFGTSGSVPRNLAPKSSSGSEIRKNLMNTLFLGLSAEQQEAVRRTHADAGQNIFLSGVAGSGKSTLLKYLIAEAKFRCNGIGVAVTGSTGVAAVAGENKRTMLCFCNDVVTVSGTTIHNWSGIGLGDGAREDVLTRVRSNKTAVVNWLKVCFFFFFVRCFFFC
jgi:ATP-dependent DNA helicase PIF1